MRVPEDYVDYSECNCDQALLYLAIIDALIKTQPYPDCQWGANKPLYEMAKKLVEKIKGDYTNLDLPARLKRLEEK